MRKALESGTTIAYLIALRQLRGDKQREMHLREIRGRDGVGLIAGKIPQDATGQNCHGQSGGSRQRCRNYASLEARDEFTRE